MTGQNFVAEQAWAPRHDEGMEVVPGTAPEWMSNSGWVEMQEYELRQKIPAASKSPEQHKTDDPYTHNPGLHSANSLVSRPWYKRKLILGAIAGIIILVIALGAGLGAGLSKSGSSSNEGSNPDDGGGHPLTGPCGSDLCPQLLAVGEFYDELYVFARSVDKKTIAFRKYNVEDSEWRGWANLGELDDGLFKSPPAVRSWPLKEDLWRLDVFAVGDDNSAYNQWYSLEEEWPGWEEVGENVGTPISTCFVTRKDWPNRIDIWTTDGGPDDNTMKKNLWRNTTDMADDLDGITEEHGGYDIDEWLHEYKLSGTESQPAVACPHSSNDNERYHDLMWYSEERSKLLHSSYSDADNWSAPPREFPGKWIGDPSLFTGDDTHHEGHFFGVQDDHKMYHISWKANGFLDGSVEKMNGSVFSAPGFESPSRDVLDIVALNENGALMHQHRELHGWNETWEDLGIKAASAPSVRAYQDTLWIFALNDRGQLMAWSRKDEPKERWRDSLNEENLGGSLSLESWT